MSQQVEQALVSVVITKLHFFQVERELFLGDAVEFDQSLLGVTPETLNAVYIDLAVGKELFVIDIDMTITVKHERVVTRKFVGVDDAATPHRLDREVQESAGLDVIDCLDLDDPVTLQYAENRDFTGGPTTALALASAPEVALVHLDHSAEEFGAVGGVGNDGGTYHVDGLEDRRVTESWLLGDLPGRELKLEELYYPEPVLARDSKLVDHLPVNSWKV